MRGQRGTRVLGLMGLTLLVAFFGSGCSRQATHLSGTWELTRSNGQRVQGETLQKLLTGRHFTIVRLRPDGTAEAAGGEYTLEDGAYTELIDYHWLPGLTGRALTFDCRLEGDLWYHSGGSSAGGQDLRVNEVWRRIE